MQKMKIPGFFAGYTCRNMANFHETFGLKIRQKFQ